MEFFCHPFSISYAGSVLLKNIFWDIKSFKEKIFFVEKFQFYEKFLSNKIACKIP